MALLKVLPFVFFAENLLKDLFFHSDCWAPIIETITKVTDLV